MDRDQIIARLKATEPDLRARGVCHAALFGSRARGDHSPDSDIDILVEFDPDARVTIYDYVGIKDYVAELMGVPVDVVDKDGLKPAIVASVEAAAVYAF
jgi:predicted nucleotidyltransferase